MRLTHLTSLAAMRGEAAAAPLLSEDGPASRLLTLVGPSGCGNSLVAWGRPYSS